MKRINMKNTGNLLLWWSNGKGVLQDSKKIVIRDNETERMYTAYKDIGSYSIAHHFASFAQQFT